MPAWRGEEGGARLTTTLTAGTLPGHRASTYLISRVELLRFGEHAITCGQGERAACSILCMTSAAGLPSRIAGQSLLTSFYTGGVLAVFVSIAALSFGSLIFGGELSFGVADGIGIALISAAIGGLVMAGRSSYPATIAIPQDRTAPILALMATQVAAALPPGPAPGMTLTNVLAAIALTSLVPGAALDLLGP